MFSKSCNYEKLISYRDMTLDTTCARKMSWSTEIYEVITSLSVQSMSSYQRLHFSSLANKQLISAHIMSRLFPLTQRACGFSSSYSSRKQRRAAHGNLHSLLAGQCKTVSARRWLQGMLCYDWWRGWGRLRDWVSVGWVKERS